MPRSVAASLAVAALSLFAAHAASAAIWYVDDSAPGGGTGTSWTSPFNTLQAALTAASNGDEIRLANGTYTPAGPGGARTATFTINKSVTIKGLYCGFGAFSPDGLCSGTTRLSGDLNSNDGADFANTAENSLRVVTIGSGVTVRLERLTISGGNANSGTTTGGGMFVSTGVLITCRDVDFTDNQSTAFGGAVDHNGFSTSVYKDCNFLRNRSGQYGGALSLSSGAGARVGMCRFHQNTLTAATFGTGGGAIWINGPSSVINCIFSGNVVTYTNGSAGGAIAIGSGPAASSQIVNCTFAGNGIVPAFTDGAMAIASYTGAPGPSIANCVFDNAYYSTDVEVKGNAQVTYCLGSDIPGTGNINSVFFYFNDRDGNDNIAGTLDDDLSLVSTYGVSYGIDTANAAALPADIIDFDEDGNTTEPWQGIFVTNDTAFTRFAQQGPAPDGPAAGDPPLDMGAYEARGSQDVPGPIVYVDADGSADSAGQLGSGASWNRPLGFLANAITLANTFPSVVTEIRIGGGIYRQDVYTQVTRPGLLIRGGYAGLGSNTPDTRDTDAFPTIFDGDIDSNDPPYLADITLPAYADNRGVAITAYAPATTLTIDGLRFRNILQNNIVFDTSECNVTLRDIQFARCYFGGGALIVYPSPGTAATMTDCTFDNIIYDIAGVAWLRTGATLRMVNCRVTDAKQDARFNTFPEAPGRPGGLVWHESAATSTFVNCLFNNNEAAHGAVLFTDNTGSAASFTNCTIVNNRARFSAGAIFMNSGLPQISNSILWGNTAPAHPQMFFTGIPGSTTFQNSIIQGGVSQGTNVLNVNPLFADPDGPDNSPGNADDDFRLQLNSPAVDLGSVSALPVDTNDLDRDLNTAESLPLDLDFLPRNLDLDFDGTPEPDAGAYESFANGVINITANTTHTSIAEALTASSAGHTIIAPSAQFTAEPFIDFVSKPVTLGFSSTITQPSGGRYTLTDGAILGRPVGASGPSITLNAELRVPANASAFLNASSLTNNSAINVFDNASLAAAVPGTLSGSGNLRLYPGATFSTTGSLSATGAVNALPNSTLSSTGALTLGSNSPSVFQSATVVSGGTLSIPGVTNWTNSTFTAPSLSIASTGRFTGSGSIYATTLNSGRIYTVGNTLFVGNLTNNATGIITVQLGTATLIGTLTNNGTINGILSNPPLPPPDADPETTAFYRELATTERTAQGDGLFIRGDYTAGPASSLSLPNPVWRLTVAGNYDNAINNNANYDMRQAELVLTKPDATNTAALEAMSLDRGPTDAALNRNLPASFPIGTLRITSTTTATTTDNHDNALDGTTACEAVYTENLIIEPGATLTATSCRVYYRNLTNQGTITTPQNVIAIPPPCGGADFNNDTIVDTSDLVFFIGRFGQPSTPGSQAARADFNNNGIVDTPDLVYFIGRFGSTCP